jgi:hypothetical protein
MALRRTLTRASVTVRKEFKESGRPFGSKITLRYSIEWNAEFRVVDRGACAVDPNYNLVLILLTVHRPLHQMIQIMPFQHSQSLLVVI